MAAIVSDIVDLLNSEAARINSEAFIAEDPVQFPRRFTDQRDIEIVALLSAIIAWGRRSMICRDAERMLGLMDYQPYEYIKERGYECLDPSMNLHRTFFARHMQWLMRGLRKVYEKYDTLDGFSRSVSAAESAAPAWHIADALQRLAADENGGELCSQCLPTNLESTALKRINMALRWLVRDDGIVDMGIWRSIDKSRLFIPLDVHVGNTARDLGLLDRKSNDRRAVEQLTAVLRGIRPDDPVYYDYALFGIGVEGGQVASDIRSHCADC